MLPGKLHYNGLLCMQELAMSQMFISPVTCIFSQCMSHKNNIIFNHLHDMFHFN